MLRLPVRYVIVIAAASAMTLAGLISGLAADRRNATLASKQPDADVLAPARAF
jgi:hypothetical protein